jgi:P27 family predicted phage terminase small subunit
MQGGHNKKSDDLHKLQGTKPTPPVPVEGAAVQPGRPRFPKGLTPEERRIFKSLCAELEQRRHLSTGDGELLYIYATERARWARAKAKLTEQGEIRTYVRLDSNGQPHDQEKPNLWLKVAQDSARNMVACLDRLGLTPNARHRIKPTGDAVPAAEPEQSFEDKYFADLDTTAKGLQQ